MSFQNSLCCFYVFYKNDCSGLANVLLHAKDVPHRSDCKHLLLELAPRNVVAHWLECGAALVLAVSHPLIDRVPDAV